MRYLIERVSYHEITHITKPCDDAILLHSENPDTNPLATDTINVWCVEFDTLEDMNDFIKRIEHPVIIESKTDSYYGATKEERQMPLITIYDDYIE